MWKLKLKLIDTWSTGLQCLLQTQTALPVLSEIWHFSPVPQCLYKHKLGFLT